MTKKSIKLSLVSGLCLLLAGLAQAATATWDFETNSGSGPYPVGSSDTNVILASSHLTLDFPITVTATISPGATTPGSGNFSYIHSSSQAINAASLVFTFDATGPVHFGSMSYAAIVFQPVLGPNNITWTASVNYGSGDIALLFSLVDDYGRGNWNSYNPGFNFDTTAAATITIHGNLGNAFVDTQANNNGDVGFDNFVFNVEPVPEPSTVALIVLGLVLFVCTTRKFRRNRSGGRF